MKRAYVLMTPEFIGDICKPSEPGYLFKIKSIIPIDAQFITASYSYEHGSFMVIFEHDSFEDILQGNRMPSLACPEFTKIKD